MVTMVKTIGLQYPLTLKSTVLLEITLSKCLASDQIGRVLHLSTTIDPEVELGVPTSRTEPCFSFSCLTANRYGEPGSCLVKTAETQMKDESRNSYLKTRHPPVQNTYLDLL